MFFFNIGGFDIFTPVDPEKYSRNVASSEFFPSAWKPKSLSCPHPPPKLPDPRRDARRRPGLVGIDLLFFEKMNRTIYIKLFYSQDTGC